jgi:hypothetical protein
MGEHKKEGPKFQVDKASVQRLLDAANILRAVTSQDDIDRIKRKLEISDDRTPFDKRRVPPHLSLVI